MKLGNSGGKNTGKKYLKLTGEESISLENQQKYDQFTQWFEISWNEIKNQLIIKGLYNSDIINDTFLKIGTKILYGGLEIKDYPSYFMRSCFTNNMQATIAESTYIRRHESIDVAEFLVTDHLAYESSLRELQQDIFDHIRIKYSPKQVYIFETYIINKADKYSFRKLAEVCGISTYTIHTIVTEILKEIRNNPRLKNQYKEISL